MKVRIFLIFVFTVLLISCKENTILEKTVIQYKEIAFAKSYFFPGEMATWDVWVETDLPQADIKVNISHGQHVLESWEETKLVADDGRLAFQWQAPLDSPVGYGLDIYIRSEQGEDWELLVSAGFDVLDHWTQTPRYGFLTDFAPHRENPVAAIQTLNRFHINGLQFYDWMYKHEDYLTDSDPYKDPLGRELSIKTVSDLIEAAHQYRMAAMPYTAIYAATYPFYQEHPDWTLYDRDQKPHQLGENFLIIMDASAGSEFGQHLLTEFEDILDNTAFDGIHLDQYGYPKIAFDINGEPVNVEDNFVEMINATRELAQVKDPKNTVVFNAVNNWPVNKVALSDEDLIYIEVWEPHDYFIDLHNLIRQAQRLDPEKPVVLAAYNEPEHLHNVILSDAIIFASGGSHIELGEYGNMLQDPYFPNYGTMSETLTSQMVRMYDFYVRYQDYFGPRTSDASADYGFSVTEEDGQVNIQPIFRQGERHITCSLVNFTDTPLLFWRGAMPDPPQKLEAFDVQIKGVEKQVSAVWLASPDTPSLEAVPAEFVQDEDQLTLTVPELLYWQMVVIEVNP